MFMCALILAGIISQAEQISGDPYSAETKKRYETYTICFAKGVYGRRQSSGSAEAHMLEAKAACRREYDAFVAGAVQDSQDSSDPALVADRARSILDAMDARAIIDPPPPANLAQLPVSGFAGEWRSGNGPLADNMSVRFADDGSLVGVLKSNLGSLTDELRSWKITSEGRKEAVFWASFSDGRVVKYDRIPSFPSEMDFINPSDPSIKRVDILIEDNSTIIVRLISSDVGTQIRFSRQTGTSPEKR